MARKVVGIDLGTHQVKIVVANVGLRGLQILHTYKEGVGVSAHASKERTDPLSQALAVALTSLRDRGLLGLPVGISLPPSLLSYRVLKFPFSDERRIAQTIAFEADGQFAVPLEDLVYNHLVVSSPSSEGRALVVAAQRDRVEQITRLFRQAGGEIKLVTSPAIAAAQVCKVSLPPPDPESQAQPVALLVDVGHQFTHFVAISSKGPVAVRTLRRGGRQLTAAIAKSYGYELPRAESAKHADAFVPHHGLEGMSAEQLDAGRLVARTLEPILREIEHTRLWLRANYQADVKKVLLAGGSSALNGLVEYIGEQTGLPTERATAGAAGLRLDPGQPTEVPVVGLAALGAALGAARKPWIQLHDESTPGAAESGWIQEKITSIAAIGIAVLAFGALDTIARVRAGEAELVAYTDQLDELSVGVFGEALNPSEIDLKFAGAETEDLTQQIPKRGALEVLAMITKLSTPSDLESDPPKPAGVMDESEDDPESEPEFRGGDPTSTARGPISSDSGVVTADAMTFSRVQIGERKIELQVSANTSSAQDRLVSKLTQTGCMTNFLKGKVKGNDRRNFELDVDHNCFRANLVEDEDEAEH